MANDDLQKRLEHLGDQLLKDIEAWEVRTRTDRAKTMERITHKLEEKLERALDKAERAQERKQERKARKEARKRREEAPSVIGGVIELAVAAVCAVIAANNHDLFWMIFVALGFGLAGASQLAKVARVEKALADSNQAATPSTDPPARHEVDVTCDQLLADLAAAPEAVRAFVSQPEKTVASMRVTLKSLDQRRQQLLAEDAKGRLAQLEQQRQSLQARHDAATDPETKQRMEEALHSMGGQRQALEHLALMTERVDGEYTSLLVHLQELRTRVSVAKSTTSSVQLEGVKTSVKRLNDELGAISEALEAVRRGEASPVSEIGTDEGAVRTKERTR